MEQKAVNTMNNDMASIIWQQYQAGLNYFERSGLTKNGLTVKNFTKVINGLKQLRKQKFAKTNYQFVCYDS